jgi:UDP-N-acetylglucosamine acyltransferase
MTKIVAHPASETFVHPSSIVETGAELGTGVYVGPFCHVGPDVRISDGAKLFSHVAVTGWTTIAENVEVYPFASVGHRPQDLKFKGEKTTLTVGAGTTIREGCTLNPGTEGGGGVTSVGANCLLMAGVHIAHDCRVDDHVILANNATLAGHVSIGERAVLGGLCAVHQIVRIGNHAMVGGMTGVENDVIPYGMVMGNRAQLSGLNLIGMERSGMSKDNIRAMRAAYRLLFEDVHAVGSTLAERLKSVESDFSGFPEILKLIAFMRVPSQRGVCQPRNKNNQKSSD